MAVRIALLLFPSSTRIKKPTALSPQPFAFQLDNKTHALMEKVKLSL
jgi:hypothetical protein